jgi:hypothetical protein
MTKMTKNFNSFRQILSGLMLIFFMLQTSAYGATEITGTIIEKRAGSVKVEFEPHKTAAPQKGDRVDFKKLFKGYQAEAGHGEVMESGSGFVWVNISDNRPNLKMVGIIQATGTSKEQLDNTSNSNAVSLKEPSGKSMSPQDIKIAVIQELIRLGYIQKMDKTMSKDMLQQAIEFCRVEQNEPNGNEIDRKMLETLRKLEFR